MRVGDDDLRTQDKRSKERGRMGILKMKNEANSQFPEEKGKGRRREKGRKGEREKWRKGSSDGGEFI